MSAATQSTPILGDLKALKPDANVIPIDAQIERDRQIALELIYELAKASVYSPSKQGIDNE